jgi:cytochrome c peroxidase
MGWAVAASLVGCGGGEREDPGTASAAAAIEAAAPARDDVVIPRVPNPPLQSDLVNLPGDLRAIPVPRPSDLGAYVRDEEAAIALGKALFWDMQVGSDGKTACGTCHFRAGADPRSKNQLTPGLNHVPAPDLTFTTGGPNHQLTPDDFPLTRLAVPGVRGALDPATDSNDAVSSQGVPFLSPLADPDGFEVRGLKTRRVEARNAPTVINAAFNHRQFWDGRADPVFNGVNFVGERDPDATLFRADGTGLAEVRVAIDNASLASQALQPIVADLEMAEPGRTVLDLARELARGVRGRGKQLCGARPLARQQVSRTDSVLGDLARYPRPGLTMPSYDAMIRKAFQPAWWRSSRLIRVRPDGTTEVATRPDRDPETEEYTLMQYNFGLFFGLSLQLYQATLIADETPWDRFRRAHPDPTDPALNPWTNTDPEFISRQALFGAMLFNDRTRGPTNLRCSNCHEQAELTDDSVRRVAAAANGPVRNRDGNVIDKGFNNIGVRPTADDLGVGRNDAFGPLSFAKRLFPDGPPAFFDGAAVTKGFGVEGAFKVPSLRNVALTAPYFHNGDAHNLREVMEFYSRGGNVAPITQLDGTPIEPLGVPALTDDEIDAVIAFLEALTDERVLPSKAPFDHPQLFVPNGHPGDEDRTRDRNRDGFADDRMVEIPAVGAEGGRPLPGFLEGIFGPKDGRPRIRSDAPQADRR